MKRLHNMRLAPRMLVDSLGFPQIQAILITLPTFCLFLCNVVTILLYSTLIFDSFPIGAIYNCLAICPSAISLLVNRGFRTITNTTFEHVTSTYCHHSYFVVWCYIFFTCFHRAIDIYRMHLYLVYGALIVHWKCREKYLKRWKYLHLSRTCAVRSCQLSHI